MNRIDDPLAAVTVLVLPGLHGSGPAHWQSRWQVLLPHAQRVQQRDWDAPQRAAWVAALDRAVDASRGELVLAAHSLGCATVLHWLAACARPQQWQRIRGALLVAVPDVERATAPDTVRDFAPLPLLRLPFAAVVVASSDDPWCELARAQRWATEWGADWQPLGACGHVNATSGLGDWRQGLNWLRQLSV